MVRSILAVMLVAFLAVGASAYDFLYTSDSAMTHDAGTFGIEAEFAYSMADAGFDEDGEKVDFPEGNSMTMSSVPIDIYYAVMDNFEIGVQPKFVMLNEEYDYMMPDPADTTLPIDMINVTGESDGTGIGDTWVWGKYMFMPEPMLTGRVGLKVATGDDEPGADELPTGDGQMDIDGALMFGVPAGPGMFDLAVGYRYRMEHSDTKYKPGDEVHFAAKYTYYLNDAMNLRIGGDGFFGSDSETDGETDDKSAMNAVWVNPGFDYMMENGMTVGVDFHYPLMGQNTPALWGFSGYVGWGSM